eukprot:1232593-Pleurochrysis_carterae.AAC.1
MHTWLSPCWPRAARARGRARCAREARVLRDPERPRAFTRAERACVRALRACVCVRDRASPTRTGTCASPIRVGYVRVRTRTAPGFAPLGSPIPALCCLLSASLADSSPGTRPRGLSRGRLPCPRLCAAVHPPRRA